MTPDPTGNLEPWDGADSPNPLYTFRTPAPGAGAFAARLMAGLKAIGEDTATIPVLGASTAFRMVLEGRSDTDRGV